MNLSHFRDWIYNQHDKVCNQKYDNIYPYSMHLSFVEAQGEKFIHLIDEVNWNEQEIVWYGLIAHDAIEDARMTYNDVKEAIKDYGGTSNKVAEAAADIVYCVTDDKGKTRKERKSPKYYEELKKNKLALFVKLADLAANRLYSKLTNSSMYEKYKKEWPKFKETLYLFEYDEFFEYVENI